MPTTFLLGDVYKRRCELFAKKLTLCYHLLQQRLANIRLHSEKKIKQPKRLDDSTLSYITSKNLNSKTELYTLALVQKNESNPQLYIMTLS